MSVYSELFEHCNPDQAQKYIERAYKLCNEGTEVSYPPTPMSCAYIAYNLGSLLQNDRNFADALPYFQNAISKFIEAEQAGDFPHTFFDYRFLAQAAFAESSNPTKLVF